MRGISKHPCDPSDVIHEAFRIDGIDSEACRAIFFDWAMGLDPGLDMVATAKTLHAELAGDKPDHPMAALLAEAARGITPARGRRRGKRN